MTNQVIIEPLGAHVREEFSCGVAALDRYFKEQVTQDIRRHITNCFVAVTVEGGGLAGYFTLAACSIPLADLPAEAAKRLPRYAALPAALIGRLAVDARFRSGGIGGALLADAFQRAARSEPAVFALLVDAKDEAAVRFYRHHGFATLESDPRRLFLSIASAEKIFRKSRT